MDSYHIYDHVTSCKACYDGAVDYIFSEFAKDGVAVAVSGIRQTLRYFDQYFIKMIEGEVSNGEACNDNQSKESEGIRDED